MHLGFATIATFVVGLLLLIAGAELLVRGAARLASMFGVSALVIGLTVVAFGTGSPELAVAVRSAWTGQSDIAIGNVIGSNIFNILFILGLSSVIVPLVVHEQLVRIDVPVMIACAAVLYLMAADGVLGRMDGIALFVGVVVYTWVLIRGSRRENGDEHDAPVGRPGGRAIAIPGLAVAGGLAMLALGSTWLVGGAVSIARVLGVSELVIGLTVIAAGTSLPEIATSVVAGIRGQRDIAVGNVVGSNIYNILMVLGLCAIVSPRGLPVPTAAINFDLPVMLAVSVACFPIFFTGHAVHRWQGAMFLTYWVAYTTYVVLAAAHHDAVGQFGAVMSAFVIPLTVVVLAVVTFREMRARRRRRRTG